MFPNVECPDCVLGQILCCTPCWGAPDDIEILIEHGYGDKLMLNTFVSSNFEIVEVLSPANPFYEGKYAETDLQRIAALRSGCVFQNWANKSCEIQSVKPKEGKVACCKRFQGASGHATATRLHESIALMWANERGNTVVNNWKQQFLKERHRTLEELRQEVILRMIDAVKSCLDRT